MFAYITNIIKRLFTRSTLYYVTNIHIDLEKAYLEECASKDLEEVPLFQTTQSPKALESLSQQQLDDMAKDINTPHLDEHIRVAQKDVFHQKVV